MKKINLVASLINIVLFLTPLVLLVVAKQGNLDLSKGLLVFYYIITSIWFCIPAMISLVLFIGKFENKILNVIMMILNIVALFWLLPQFNAYVF